MPLVRIDCPEDTPPDQRRLIGTAVYEAMREHLKVPENDRFQVVVGHGSGNLVIDPTYLDIDRSNDALIIQITLSEGRTVEMKKAFYKSVADNLRTKAGRRPEDVMINRVEVNKENWSFGKGIASYV